MWSPMNVTIRICYTEVFPFAIDTGDGSTPKAMQGSIFTNISKAMGLRWVRVPAPASTWGVCDANGTCHGQLEPLQLGTADLALGPVVFTEEAFDALRLIGPSHYSTIDAIAGFEEPFEAAGNSTIFNLFPTPIWLAVLGCVIVLPVVAKLLSRHVPRRDRVTLAEHWSPFMEILLLETPSVQYSTDPMRMLFAGWMLAALVISSLGNATLKSVMTVLSPARRLETLEDVLQLDPDKTKIRLTTGTGLFEMFMNAHYKPLNKVGEMIVKSNGMTHPLDLAGSMVLRELETRKAIFILSCDVVTPFLYSPPETKLQGTKGYTYCTEGVFGHYYAGFMAPKKSAPSMEKILDEFEKRVCWLLESPIPHLLHYEAESPMVADRYIHSKELEQPPPSPTTLTEMSGTFIAFCCLAAVSTVVLSVELLWNSRQESQRLLESCIAGFRGRVSKGNALSSLSRRKQSELRVFKRVEAHSKTPTHTGGG